MNRKRVNPRPSGRGAVKTYTLHITRQQALTLQVACEVLARLGLGQFRDALEHLPTSEWRPEGWNEDMDAIGAILSKHTIQGVDGWRHSLGIGNDKTGDTAKDAWDLHCVIRHRLSWDAAIERGDIQPGEPRKWPEMMGVSYDEPMRHGKEPLARISADTTPASIEADALREALIEAQAGLEFAAARLPAQVGDFVPSHLAALKIVNAALASAAPAPAALAGPSTEQQAAVFREYLNVHEVGGSIGRHALDAMALDLARIVDALRSRARTNASGQRGEDVAQFLTAARAAKEGA